MKKRALLWLKGKEEGEMIEGEEGSRGGLKGRGLKVILGDLGDHVEGERIREGLTMIESAGMSGNRNE